MSLGSGAPTSVVYRLVPSTDRCSIQLDTALVGTVEETNSLRDDWPNSETTSVDAPLMV